MALLNFLPETSSETPKKPSAETKKQPSSSSSSSAKRKKAPLKQKDKKKQSSSSSSSCSLSSSSSSWDQIKNLLTCKQVESHGVHDPSTKNNKLLISSSSCSSICSFRDVVHGNSRVVHRADNSPETSSLGQETRLLTKKSAHATSSSSSSRSLASSVRTASGGGGGGGGGTSHATSSSYRGMQFRKLSGCYECRMIVDPSRYPLPRTTICTCPDCGEVFPKIESLEHHQAIRHAVSELGPEDSSRNIVEIIFKSSWLKKDNPICKIERILKVHNTQRTIQRFEDCREAVKLRANANHKKNARCAADGNELLRFHCTTLACSLGSRGSTALCGSLPGCGVCTIIRHGFQGVGTTRGSTGGVRTTASSGRAHDCLNATDHERRAMLVCRVIAGRVRRAAEDSAAEEDAATGSYDSVAEYVGIYSSLEELHVFHPRAILPCFVVIYKALES